MKKLLITGINGYIGSNARKYFKNDYEIYGIDLFGAPEKNIIIGEVDEKNLKSFNQNFDVIIHLAGSSTVGATQRAPEVEKTKAVGSTQEILNYIKKYNKNAKLIFSSSASVYGNNYKRPIKEDDTLSPISIYGSHKLECEKLFFEKGKDLDIKIVRIFSLYGEGLKKQLLWDFSNRAMKADKKITAFGTGDEKRDFIHILDLLKFFELMISRKSGIEIYNCASGTSVTTKEVMDNLVKELNLDLKLVFDNIKREGNPEILTADIKKAQNIGFKPEISFSEGIKRYAKWFSSNY